MLFCSLLVAPSVWAASSYDWQNITTGTSLSGKGWRRINVSASGQYMAAIVYGGDVYASADFGSTWTDVTPSGSLHNKNWSALGMSATGQYLTASIDSGDTYVSSDYGQTWADASTSGGAPQGLWQPQGIAVSATGQYQVSAPDQGDTDIYLSSDYGATWVNKTASGVGHGQAYSSAVISDDGQYIVGGASGNSGGDLFTSSNQGTSWTDRTAVGTRFWQNVATNSSGQYMAAQDDGGDIYISSDYGVNWADKTTSGAAHNQIWGGITSSSSGQYMAAIADYTGHVYTSSDYGDSWSDVTPSGGIGSGIEASIASNATGQYLAAVDAGGDIFVGQDPSLAVNTAHLNSDTVLVVVPVGNNLTCSSMASESGLSQQDKSYTYPLGLLNLCFTTQNADNQVSVTFVTDLKPSQVVARDFNPATGTYMDVPGALITQTTYNGRAALNLTYTLTDNGSLDSNSAQYSVSDPVGLAVADGVAAPNTGYGTPRDPSAGIALFIFSGLISAGAGLRFLYKERQPQRQIPTLK